MFCLGAFFSLWTTQHGVDHVNALAIRYRFFGSHSVTTPNAHGRVSLLAAASPARSSRSLITVMTSFRHNPKEATDHRVSSPLTHLATETSSSFLVLSLAALHSRVHQYVSRPRDRSHHQAKPRCFREAEERSSPVPSDEPFRCLPLIGRRFDPSSKNTFDTAL